MNPKLKALLGVAGAATLGGVPYLILKPEPGVTRADLVDAGITSECARVVAECEGRWTCEGAPRRLLTLEVPGYRCQLEDGGSTGLLPALTRRQRQCFEVRDHNDCIVLGAAPEEDDEALILPLNDRCWCRAVDGGLCRWRNPLDGGVLQMRHGVAYPGPTLGVACRRAACGEFAGEVGSSLHDDCVEAPP